MEENKPNTLDKKIPVKGDDLTRVSIFFYGIGHFMNDLCAACWFFFLSYYLKDILKLGEFNSGYVMLAGQIADAVATPIVGILSDKTETKIGKRTPWYIGGTILVAITFTLIFIEVIPKDSSDSVRLTYYIICASLFNIGWASVQVSHMSLLPLITLNKKNKDKMNRIRTGFTFLAATFALAFSYIIFLMFKKSIQYEILAVVCVAIGTITSVLFLIMCQEIKLSKNISNYYENMRTSLLSHEILPQEKESGLNKSITKEENEGKKIIHWTYWLTVPDFYAYMLVYMFVRLSINVTQSVTPFYMEYMLGYHKTPDGGTPYQISIVLLISTIGSILNSIIVQPYVENRLKNSKKKRLIMITFAAILISIGCVPMFFLSDELRYPIYFLSFFSGIGFSQGFSTVGNLINDVVGSKGAYSAIVYGAYSFTDKLSSGLVLAFFIPYASNPTLLKYTLPIFPTLSLLIAFIIVYLRTISKKEEYKNFNLERKKSFLDDSRFTFVSNTNNSSSNLNI